MRPSEHLLSIRTSVACLALLAGCSLLAQDGLLDPTFGQGGLAHDFISVNRMSIPSQVRFDAEGRVVVAGNFNSQMVDHMFGLRYLPDGRLDSTFGTNGLAIANFCLVDESLGDMRIAADGSIYLIGYEVWLDPTHQRPLSVTRWDTDGIVDTSYGVDGVFSFVHAGHKTFGSGVDVQSGNRVVGCGQHTQGATAKMLVFRTTPAGVLDTSFGTNGVVLPSFGGTDEGAFQVRVQPDDRILVLGVAQSMGVLMRFLPDGEPDPAFADNGVFAPGFYGYSASKIHLMADGRIVVLFDDGATIVRLLPDGTLDPTYGVGGIAHLQPDHVHDKCSALLPDGRVVVAYDPSVATYAMLCVGADGLLDTAFGTNGYAMPPDICCHTVMALEAGPGPRFVMTTAMHSDVWYAQQPDPGVIMFTADSVPQDLPTGIAERAPVPLLVHPDPYSDGPLFLQVAAPMANTLLEVFDAQGRRCGAAKLGDVAAHQFLDVHAELPALAPGLYRLRLRAGDGRQGSAPLVVQ